MNAVFAKILEMSLYGSIAILIVLLFRLIFKNCPKRVLILFWIAVAVRLVIPYNSASPTGVLNVEKLFSKSGKTEFVEVADVSGETGEVAVSGNGQKQGDLISDNQSLQGSGAVEASAEAAVASAFGEEAGDYGEKTDVSVEEAVGPLAGSSALTFRILTDIWLLVMAGLVIFFTIRYLVFYSKARWDSRSYDGKYFTTSIETPFVIGFIRPKIFIPIHFDDDEKEYILNHEWTHIKNKDGVTKLFSYFVLCLHWFNPLVWLAFIMLCADIEMRVDEETTELFDVDMIKEYCMSLVKHAEDDRRGSFLQNTAFSGLGFGGMETKLRIKNLLKNKHMSKVMTILTVCVTFAVVLLLSSRSYGSTVENYLDRAGKREEKETVETVGTDVSGDPGVQSIASGEASASDGQGQAPDGSEEPSETGRKNRFTCFEEAYMSIIEEHGLDNDNVKYALVHIGYDEIPELVVSDFSNFEYPEFGLVVYTFRTDRTYTVIDWANADFGEEHFFCYEPYSEYICYYQKPMTGDATVQPYTVYQRTMDDCIYHLGGEDVEYSGETPNDILAGYDDAKTMMEYLSTGHLPQEQKYTTHPKYAPSHYVPPEEDPTTWETEDTYGTLPEGTIPEGTTEAPKTESSYSEQQEPTAPRENDAYSIYYGYYDYYPVQTLTLEPAREGYIMISCYQENGVSIREIEVPISGNEASFFYRYVVDTNGNGVIDEGETRYRKATLYLSDPYISLIFYDIEYSDFDSSLDYTKYVIDGDVPMSGTGLGFTLNGKVQ